MYASTTQLEYETETHSNLISDSGIEKVLNKQQPSYLGWRTIAQYGNRERKAIYERKKQRKLSAERLVESGATRSYGSKSIYIHMLPSPGSRSTF